MAKKVKISGRNAEPALTFDELVLERIDFQLIPRKANQDPQVELNIVYREGAVGQANEYQFKGKRGVLDVKDWLNDPIGDSVLYDAIIDHVAIVIADRSGLNTETE